MLETLYQFKPYIVPFCTACAVHIGIVTFYATGDTQSAQALFKQGYSALELTMTPSAQCSPSLAASQPATSRHTPVADQDHTEPNHEVAMQMPVFPFDTPQTPIAYPSDKPLWRDLPAKEMREREDSTNPPAEADTETLEASEDAVPQEPDSGDRQVTSPCSDFQDADLREKGVDSPSQLASQIKVEYPRVSRKNGEEGIVRLKIDLSAFGTVEKVFVAQSSGYRRLDRAAQDAVLSAQFAPALRNGKPVGSTMDLTILFKLDERQS
ncbi:MAG: energy transducer TonB [Candidatus Auribacterota bacterium]|jgi:protein TonB|nr:energy transducer TonB [Candidatus Auribacterota bacterium]